MNRITFYQYLRVIFRTSRIWAVTYQKISIDERDYTYLKKIPATL